MHVAIRCSDLSSITGKHIPFDVIRSLFSHYHGVPRPGKVLGMSTLAPCSTILIHYLLPVLPCNVSCSCFFGKIASCFAVAAVAELWCCWLRFARHRNVPSDWAYHIWNIRWDMTAWRSLGSVPTPHFLRVVFTALVLGACLALDFYRLFGVWFLPPAAVWEVQVISMDRVDIRDRSLLYSMVAFSCQMQNKKSSCCNTTETCCNTN